MMRRSVHREALLTDLLLSEFRLITALTLLFLTLGIMFW